MLSKVILKYLVDGMRLGVVSEYVVGVTNPKSEARTKLEALIQ